MEAIFCSFNSLLNFLLQKSHMINFMHMNISLLYRPYAKPHTFTSVLRSEEFSLLSQCFYKSITVKMIVISS